MVSRSEKRREKEERRKEVERLEEKRRKEEERRDEKRRAMPSAEEPTGVVELAGHGKYEVLRCIVPLPGGDRVATASDEGKVRVFAVATGALEHELDAHKRDLFFQRALATLGGDIVVSGEFNYGKVVTWNAATGERLGEAAAGGGVLALAARDGGRFVAGTRGGDVVFYTHRGGRGLEETARIAGAHNRWVSDFAVRRAAGDRVK
jgi:WD40 repeat protein